MQCKISRGNSIYSPNHSPRPPPESCTPSPISLSLPLPVVEAAETTDSEQKVGPKDELPSIRNSKSDTPQGKLVLVPLDSTQSKKELTDSSHSSSSLHDSSEKPQLKEDSGSLPSASSRTPQEEIHSVSLRRTKISPLSESLPSPGESTSPVSHLESTVPNWDAAALRIITFLSSRINPNVSFQ